MGTREETEECPHCGAVIARGRLACPECGSDANTGWKSADDLDYEAVELPDDGGPARRPSRAMFWVLALAAVAFALAAVSWR